MKKTKRSVWLVIAILLAITSISIAFFAPEWTDSRQLQIIYVSKVLDYSNDFWTQLIEGMNMAAENYNISLSVVGPSSESDYKRQNELIEEAIAKHPDLIILAPCHYTATCDMAEKIVKNDIQLVLVDSKLKTSHAQLYVATDNIQAGRRMGTFLYQLADENSRIAILGHEQSASTTVERINGLKAGLNDKEKLIVETSYSGSDYDAAQNTTQALLQAHPEITIIAATNEYTTVGAARAIKQLGLEQRVSLVGFDSSVQEIQLLEEGLLKATVVQRAFKMGYYALEYGILSATDKDIPQSIDSGSILITNENLYLEENQKILFPFR